MIARFSSILGIVLVFGALLIASGIKAEELQEYVIPPYKKQLDLASVKNGFETYMQFCASCHKAKYVRHKSISEDLGISWEEYTKKWLGGDASNHFLSNTWTDESAKEVFGVAPPDLSLIASRKDAEWVYRYLHSFYKDDSQLYGSNNVLAQNTKMPNVLSFMQGVIEKKACSEVSEQELDGCSVLVKTEPGITNDQEFSRQIRDLTNFFVYLSQPNRFEAENLAPKVLLFLVVFSFIAFLLVREFWKDVPR